MSDSDDSDYIVEHFVKPDKIGKPANNDESADLLGNFDDQKRKNIQNNAFDEEAEEEPQLDNEDDDDEDEEEEDDDAADEDDETELNGSDDDAGEEDDDTEVTTIDQEGNIASTTKRSATKSSLDREPKAKKVAKADTNSGEIGEEQITSLLRGVSKANRFVLYVTNLNFGTDKERLTQYFSQAGTVKTVRIPKKRKGGFAFVEMADVTAFKNAFALHNSMLDERPIKVQLSEAGKKKSANKKNILKQKNRKLAEMRNETKSFTKSGKNYDKSIKKEIAKEKMQQQKIWERRKARKANRGKQKTNA